jgi:putative oxidoreductase
MRGVMSGVGAKSIKENVNQGEGAMPLDQTFYATWTPRAQGLLRLVVCYLFLQHMTAKFLGFPISMGEHLPPLIVTAGVIELIGGALLLIGLWARAAAFLLSGEMAFAYFIGHAPHGSVLCPMVNHGEPAVLYCFIFLFLAAAGPGAWSVDAMRGAKV